ncbi:MAG: WD40 repeat domain-containing protein [Leptolinea sp.]
MPQVISANNAASLTFSRGQGPGSLQKLKVSPDGKTVLLSYSTALVLINLSDLKQVWQAEPGRLLWDVTFSKDGSRLISASQGGTVQIYDAASGSLLSKTITQREGVFDIALSEFGEYFAIVDYTGVTSVWDTATGKKVQENNGLANPGGITGIRLSPGGGMLLIDGIGSKLEKQVQQWKVTDGTYKIGLLGLILEMGNWKFTPDASRIFAINYQSLTANRSTILTAWNANNGALIKTYPAVGLITRYVISPDGSTILAATEDHQLHLINVETGTKKGSFTGHTAEIAGMDFSPDGQGVVSIDVDGKIITWDVFNQKQIGTTNSPAFTQYSPVAFSTFGRLAALLSPDMKKVGVLDTSTWKPIQLVGPEQNLLTNLAMSPAGTYVAACDELSGVFIWEVASGKKVQMIEAKTRAPIFKMKFSPDEKSISTLSAGQVFIWSVTTGEKKKEFAGYNDFDYSPVENIIASDSMDYNLYFTDVDSGKKLSVVKGEYNNSIKYSPDGKYLAIGGQKNQTKDRGLNNLVYLVDSKTKERMPVEMPELPGMVTESAFNPNMDLLATRDGQGNVAIWDLRNGKQVALFEEISMAPGSLTFNQDGSLLFVGGKDGTIGVILTSASSSTSAPAAAQPAEVAAPELSAQPYTHTSGAVTVTLPKGWKVEERDNLSLKADHPDGLGSIIISASNSADSSDGSFIKFIDDTEKRLLTALPGLVETERKVDALKDSAFVTHEVEGKFVVEVYYTRADVVDYSVTFITDKNFVEAFLPVYKGVFASIKINKEYMQKQLSAGIAVPELSDQPYAHTSGAMTVTLPKDWKVVEPGTLTLSATDPSGGLGMVLVMVTNTIKPLSDESFINFINATGLNFSASSPGMKETDRKVEAQKSAALLTYLVGSGNSEIKFEMFFTRVDALVTLMTFMTPKIALDTYLPIYQGVAASYKLNKEYALKQVPYQSGPTIKGPAGKFEYMSPASWTNTPSGANVRYTAPDGSASLNTDVIELKAGDKPTDDQIYTLMLTALQKQEKDAKVVRKEKTTVGDWQVTYTLPTKKINGIIKAIRIDDSLQALNVTYETALDAQYKPLAVKLIEKFKKK